MARLPIGLSLAALNLPLRAALAAAQKLEIGGVEVNAVGELAPRQLSQTARREVRHLARAHDLECAALYAPLRHGLDVADKQEARIDYIRDCLTLSFDLGPRRVVIEAGQIPERDDDPRAPLLRDALLALAQHGDRVGATLALQTGPETAVVLADYLGRFDTGSLGVCFSPGAYLVHGHDPYGAARTLASRLVYAHATDARYTSPSRGVRPIPVGHGDIDWLQMLAVFEEIGYRGWLTVPAEAGPDASAGVQFLQRVGRVA